MKMLAWPNGKHVGFNRRLMGYYTLGELKRGRSDALRRRNRAREVEAVRIEIERETVRVYHRTHQEIWQDGRPFDMNDEYTAPSNAVWNALAENDDGLRFIDFEGEYSVG